MSRRSRLAALTASLAVALATATAPATAASPGALFAKGFNTCKAVPLAAIQKAGGQKYGAGVFQVSVCTWKTSGAKAEITLSTYPTSIGTMTMNTILTLNGKGGNKAVKVSVPGASKAVLETTPPQNGEVHKALFVLFPKGVLSVSMTSPGSLADSRPFAVVKALTCA